LPGAQARSQIRAVSRFTEARPEHQLCKSNRGKQSLPNGKIVDFFSPFAIFFAPLTRRWPAMDRLSNGGQFRTVNGFNRRRLYMNKPLIFTSAMLLAAALNATAVHAQATVVSTAITETEVLAAQEGWCDALVGISAKHESEGKEAAKAMASDVIDAAYGYQMGVVLFKPTLTVAPQTFRTTKDGALAYFVGGDPAYPDDKGFALKGWTACKIANIEGDSASTMGNVIFTNKDGSVTTVDKTWMFVKDDAGALRIVVHHSSLPYTP
jgi:hypothetical protein